MRNEELHDLYSTPNIKVNKSKITRWVRRVANMGARTGVNRVLVGKSDGRSQLRRPKCGRDDNIKINFQETVLGLAWIELAQDRTSGGLL